MESTYRKKRRDFGKDLGRKVEGLEETLEEKERVWKGPWKKSKDCGHRYIPHEYRVAAAMHPNGGQCQRPLIKRPGVDPPTKDNLRPVITHTGYLFKKNYTFNCIIFFFTKG